MFHRSAEGHEMNKDRSYFVFLETLEKPGCPICHLVVDDSRRYLETLMYERVLDAPTRLGVMDSFGFCNWHTWQTPPLPPVCAPTVGFSIFASDLLRKFDLLTQATLDKDQKRRIWKIPLKGAMKRLSSLMKSKACPVCVYVARGESYYLQELADFIEEEQFLSAYKRSDGICLPHFFSLEQRLCDHANFPILERLQLQTIQSLRNTLDEFIRKQDHQFHDQIASSEASAWRTAMELLAGKPGVFNNEMRRDVAQDTRTDFSSLVDLPNGRSSTERFTVGELIASMKSAKEITLYLRQSLTPDLLKAVKHLASCDSPPRLEVVVEDLQDSAHLRILYTTGFSVFYGLGLPRQTVVFLERNRGFLLEDHQLSANRNFRALKKPEDLYLRLLWCRFGSAILLSGCVKEKAEKSGLFCLTVDGGREQWCRVKDSVANKLSEVGAKVELFGWDKWNTRVLEVLELKEL
jgi:hypothetical protein